MRILRIYPFLPPLGGGMEKHILRLTEEQRKLGCEVVLAFNRGNATASSDINVLSGINLRGIKPQFLRDMLFYCSLIVKLAMEKRRFDAVHIHGDLSAFFLGRLVASVVQSKKLFASIHGTTRRGISGGMYRYALKDYNMVYTTGLSDARYLSSLIGKPIYWQYSGIDSDFIGSANEQERIFDIISVANFNKIKNFELVVEIAAKMSERTFLLVGDGAQRAIIEADCRRRGMANITFAGYLVPSRVAQSLRSARIFLMTSFVEGTPTVILEAMACGLAVVTSQANDYGELIKPAHNGYVIKGFNAEDYISKIQGLLYDTSLLDAISKRNREQAAYYGWPIVAKRITEWMKSDEKTIC